MPSAVKKEARRSRSGGHLPSLDGLSGQDLAILLQDEPLPCIALALAAVTPALAAEALRHLKKNQDASEILSRIVHLKDITWEQLEDFDAALAAKRQALLVADHPAGGKKFLDQVFAAHPELQPLLKKKAR